MIDVDQLTGVEMAVIDGALRTYLTELRYAQTELAFDHRREIIDLAIVTTMDLIETLDVE